MQTWWKVPSIDEGIFQREREREREPQVPEVVEVHENAGNMLSNAKEKTFKCSSALEAGFDSSPSTPSYANCWIQ
jgi:hypothetical protein